MLCSLAQPCPVCDSHLLPPWAHLSLLLPEFEFPLEKASCWSLQGFACPEAGASCPQLLFSLLFKLQCKYLRSTRLLLRAQSTSLKLEAALMGIETKPVVQSMSALRNSQGMGRAQAQEAELSWWL